MKTSDFDYPLPLELIAQTPLEPRDHSRLMVLSRSGGTIEHRRFFELGNYLNAGDVLVFNDSRVIPARLLGRKADSGGRMELLLLHRLEAGLWQALVKPGKRATRDTTLELEGQDGFGQKVWGQVVGRGEEGSAVIRFSDESRLEELGQIPLPPYIHTPLERPERYQTVYARVKGSAAAPTAGLHFTPELLRELADGGIRFAFVTLHVGLDTFRPVREEDPRQHPIHREYGELSPEVARELTAAREEGRRIICVGTTTVRLVEQAALSGGVSRFAPIKGWVSLFILPGHPFWGVDALITNFHLPRSTTLMLVSAFAGKDVMERAYAWAIGEGYRFYSFGDAMFIV